jgi:hypothetical protein
MLSSSENSVIGAFKAVEHKSLFACSQVLKTCDLHQLFQCGDGDHRGGRRDESSCELW